MYELLTSCILLRNWRRRFAALVQGHCCPAFEPYELIGAVIPGPCPTMTNCSTHLTANSPRRARPRAKASGVRASCATPPDPGSAVSRNRHDGVVLRNLDRGGAAGSLRDSSDCGFGKQHPRAASRPRLFHQSSQARCGNEQQDVPHQPVELEVVSRASAQCDTWVPLA